MTNKTNYGIKNEYKEAILRAMEYHFPGATIYLYGSRARGDGLIPSAAALAAVYRGAESIHNDIFIREKNRRYLQSKYDYYHCKRAALRYASRCSALRMRPWE